VVHFCDGTVATETREAPRGSEQSFALEAEIVEKFRKLTRAVMGAPQQDALIDAVLALEKLEDAGELARLLRVG
jgi:aconitate decarboxylase